MSNVKRWLLQNRWQILFSIGIIGVIVLAIVEILTYRIPVPYIDQWTLSQPLVEKILNDEFRFQDLLTLNGIHFAFFANVATVISVSISSWNLFIEAIIGFCTLIISFIFVTNIIYRQHSNQHIFSLYFVTAILLFSLRQNTNLLWSFSGNSWFFFTMFAVMLIWLLERTSPGWKCVPILFLLSVFASISVGAGLVLFPLVLVLLPFYRYRHWLTYLIWTVGFIYFFYVYTMNIAFSQGDLSLQLKYFITTVLSMIVSPILPASLPMRGVWYVLLFTIALGLLSANTIYFFRKDSHIRRALPWLGLVGVALGHVIITSSGRSYAHWSGETSRYVTVSILFWVGCIILSLSVWYDSPKRTYGYVNLVISSGLIGLASVTSVIYFGPLHILDSNIHFNAKYDTQCYWTYLISRNQQCLYQIEHEPKIRFIVQRIDWLFDNRLSIFEDYNEISPVNTLLPTSFAVGDKVIISAPLPQQHTQRVLFQGLNVEYNQEVPANELIRIIAGASITSEMNPVFQESILMTPQVDTSDLDRQIGLAERLWYLRASGDETFDEAIVEWLELYYDVVYMGGYWRTTVYEDIRLFVRKPTPILRFGEAVTLHEWALQSDVRQPICGEVSIEALWSANIRPMQDYTLSLVIVNEDGLGIGRADNGPGNMQTRFWKRDEIVYAQNSVKVPCEPGQYSLLIGLYVPGSVDALPIADMQGNIIGDLYYLTTLEVYTTG